jgi:ribosome-associated protein
MPEELSKSALKREAQRLQKLGLRLTQLKPDVRARVEMPQQLRQALDTHAAINSREGGRRQMQFIGKLMRKVDAAAIEAQLADLDGQSAAARHFFHALEQWRDKLIAEPHTLTDFISQHPGVERQVLRQLVSAAANSKPLAHEEPSDAHKRAQRALFKFIRSTLTEDSEQASSDQTNKG